MGMHGYFMSHSKEICGYSKHFTQKLGGYSCFGESIRVVFVRFSQNVRILFEYVGIYFGILWNTLKYFAEYTYENNGIPKGIYLGLTLNTF